MQMLDVLVEESPDGLAGALSDLIARGQGWTDKLARALGKMRREYPEAVHFVEALAPGHFPGLRTPAR